MRSSWVLAAAVGLSVALGAGGPVIGAPGQPPKAPIKKVDRAWIVGAPVLHDDSEPGLYLWLENGWFHLRALPSKSGPIRYILKLRSSAPIDLSQLGDFRGRAGRGRSATIEVAVGSVVKEGKLKTEGELTVVTVKSSRRKSAVALRLGPMAKRAVAGVRVGRY